MLDLLMKRRSIRRYKDKVIDKEVIDEIIRGALTSPSGRTIRPWELIVVTEKDTLNQLGKSRGGASAPMANAALGIIVIADPDLTDTWIEDSSIISVIIQLLSQSLGLGSCWIQAKGRFSKEGEDVEEIVRNLLDIPNKYRVECMISIGYPDEKKEMHDEGTLPYDKVHYSHFQ